MFLPGFVATAFVLTSQFSDATVKMQNASSEHRLRQELLTGYDRFVRPVLSPLTKVNVSVSLRLISLIDVDNKNHMVTSKLLIKQIWHNPFLTWDQAKHNGIAQIRMSKDEIWVPDITLLNSANNPSTETSHHYKSWVTVYNNGTNLWLSLGIHKSECEIKVHEFPFDGQECFLDFASESYNVNSLDIHLLSGIHTKESDSGQISSGEWTIREIDTQLSKEKGDCCSTSFAHVKLDLTIQRIPTFYILYLLCPCAVLSLLVFFSFIIPPENGERIGFCSSLLLALSVYLLLFSDLLPHSSKNMSLLGVMFALIFLEAACAVMSTLLVIKVLHATREVPAIVKCLFLGQCASRDKKVKPEHEAKPPKTMLKEEPCLVVTSEADDNQSEFDSPQAKKKEKTAEQREVESQIQAEENQKSWLIVARKLDRLFFWLYLLFLSTSLGIVISFSEKLSKLDVA